MTCKWITWVSCKHMSCHSVSLQWGQDSAFLLIPRLCQCFWFPDHTWSSKVLTCCSRVVARWFPVSHEALLYSLHLGSIRFSCILWMTPFSLKDSFSGFLFLVIDPQPPFLAPVANQPASRRSQSAVMSKPWVLAPVLKRCFPWKALLYLQPDYGTLLKIP